MAPGPIERGFRGFIGKKVISGKFVMSKLATLFSSCFENIPNNFLGSQYGVPPILTSPSPFFIIIISNILTVYRKIMDLVR